MPRLAAGDRAGRFSLPVVLVMGRPNLSAAFCLCDIESISFRCRWCWFRAFLSGPLPGGFVIFSRLLIECYKTGLSLPREARPFLRGLPASVSLFDIALKTLGRVEQTIC